jgi:hypothetical protein
VSKLIIVNVTDHPKVQATGAQIVKRLSHPFPQDKISRPPFPL